MFTTSIATNPAITDTRTHTRRHLHFFSRCRLHKGPTFNGGPLSAKTESHRACNEFARALLRYVWGRNSSVSTRHLTLAISEKYWHLHIRFMRKKFRDLQIFLLSEISINYANTELVSIEYFVKENFDSTMYSRCKSTFKLCERPESYMFFSYFTYYHIITPVFPEG